MPAASRTARTTSDQAGTGGSGLKQHFTTIIFAEYIVRNGVALELDGNHALVGIGCAFLDGFGNFVRLAIANTDLALAIANDSKCREAETTSAFHYLGAAIDEDDFFNHLGQTVGSESGAVTVVAARAATVKFTTRTAVVATLSSRCRCSGGSSGGGGRRGSGFGAHGLEYQTAFTGGLCEYFYFTVIRGARAVEDDRGETGGLRLGGKSDTEFLRASEVGGELLFAKFGVEARQENEGGCGVVVDGLSVNVLACETDGETRTGCGAFDFLADSPAAFLEEVGFADSVHEI